MGTKHKFVPKKGDILPNGVTAALLYDLFSILYYRTIPLADSGKSISFGFKGSIFLKVTMFQADNFKVPIFVMSVTNKFLTYGDVFNYMTKGNFIQFTTGVFLHWGNNLTAKDVIETVEVMKLKNLHMPYPEMERIE